MILYLTVKVQTPRRLLGTTLVGVKRCCELLVFIKND